ncbi:MAG: hypothetical protein PHC68_09255 [Syntrophorhabdaceae bacterium]|nr:hypothetical protein [Syntrophorhabdaceae bacterium]
MTIWIDEFASYSNRVGDIGFLTRSNDENHGNACHYRLSDHASRTNRSHEPRLTGWCGTTNNVSVTACGLARVSRVAKNGRVCLIELTNADEIAAALEELGYPGLE